jgi:hypothetical protein
MWHNGVSQKSTLKIEATILSETLADLYSNTCFHIPSNPDSQFNCRMQCLSRMTIFQSKTGPEILHKMQMGAYFKKNIKQEACSLVPFKGPLQFPHTVYSGHVTFRDKILYLQHWRLSGDKSVSHLYFSTTLKKVTSIFIQSTLIDSPPHYSP